MEMQFLAVFCLLTCELAVVLASSNKTTDLTSNIVPSYRARELDPERQQRRVTLNKIRCETGTDERDGTTPGASSTQKYEKTSKMDKHSQTKSFLREISSELSVKRRYRRRERATAGNEPDRNRSIESPENELERVESLPKPVAQIQPTDFPTDVTSVPEWGTSPVEDYEEVFTPFIPFNTRAKTPGVKNPFYPVTGESYGAYAVMCISILIFTVGIVGNIAIMCIVCHNYYMRSISNSLLANLALWDFVILFFCLPLVIFHELTKDWLLGEFSCKIIPYIEVNAILDYCGWSLPMGD